jgi:phosphoenolpyruvate carboxykinase (GTP)
MPTASCTPSTPRPVTSAWPGTNTLTNPNCMASLDKNVIFTNVALTDDGDVWWEGMGPAPAHCIDWQGKEWTPAIAAETGAKAAHPNARFTVAATNNPALDPPGTTPRACRSTPSSSAAAAPPPCRWSPKARNWVEGVYMAATMGIRNHRRRHRPAGRGAPRPVRHAAVLPATT